jgi:hypothetical protein
VADYKHSILIGWKMDSEKQNKITTHSHPDAFPSSLRQLRKNNDQGP